MKKLLFMLLLLGIATLFPQRMNSLFQVMNNASMLKQPEIIREMQMKLINSQDHIRYGLDVASITNQICEWKKLVQTEVENIDFSFVIIRDEKDTTKKKLKFNYSFLKTVGEKEVGDASSVSNDEIMKFLKGIVKSNIEIQIYKNISGWGIADATVKNVLLKFVYSGIFNENIEITLGTNNDECNKKISCALAGLLIDAIEKELESKYPSKHTDEHKNPDAMDGIENINAAIKKGISQLQDKIIMSLDGAQSSAYKLIADISKNLLNSQIGLAVTEGTGNLAGGMQYLYKYKDYWEFGLFANQQVMAKKDTINNSMPNGSLSLLGGQMRVASDDMQFDIMFAHMMSPGNKPYYEFGLGIGGLMIENQIVSINGFLSKDYTEDENTRTSFLWGLTYQRKSAGVPVLFLGWLSADKSKPVPVFQISYPLTIKQ